jgi:hypothetical protein
VFAAGAVLSLAAAGFVVAAGWGGQPEREPRSLQA